MKKKAKEILFMELKQKIRESKKAQAGMLIIVLIASPFLIMELMNIGDSTVYLTQDDTAALTCQENKPSSQYVGVVEEFDSPDECQTECLDRAESSEYVRCPLPAES